MIPQNLISALQEHSSMGFMLFYTDEDGEPRHFFSFDCETAYYGLASYSEMVLSSLKNIDKNKFQQFILDQMDNE